jgi:hypothetical protein
VLASLCLVMVPPDYLELALGPNFSIRTYSHPLPRAVLAKLRGSDAVSSSDFLLYAELLTRS